MSNQMLPAVRTGRSNTRLYAGLAILGGAALASWMIASRARETPAESAPPGPAIDLSRLIGWIVFAMAVAGEVLRRNQERRYLPGEPRRQPQRVWLH